MAPDVLTIRTSTQHHLDVEEITDDIIILKDGSGCLILSATAINFNLLSEEEQEATIYAYAAILNSLTYPIQILITSQRKDISDYLKNIKLQEDQQTNKIVKEHVRKYRRFVEETVQRNNVLDKRFYIIIPFTALELGAPTAFMSQLTGNKKLPFPISYIVEQAKNHLHPKRDHLIRQFTRLGIRLKQLNTPELIELFYKLYNPDFSSGQQLAASLSYTTPIVQGPPEIARQINAFVKNQPRENILVSPNAVAIMPNVTPAAPQPSLAPDQPPIPPTTPPNPLPTSTPENRPLNPNLPYVPPPPPPPIANSIPNNNQPS